MADQMAELVVKQLQAVEASPPFGAFLEVMSPLAASGELGHPASFLEHGCGVGHYSELLDVRFPGRFAYTGADYAPDMIEVARTHWPGRRFVVDDVFETHLDLDNFDIVCASGLIEVLPEYEGPLELFLASQARHVVLHRQRMTDGHTTIDIADAYGQITYRVVLAWEELRRRSTANQRQITHAVQVSDDVFSFLMTRRS